MTKRKATEAAIPLCINSTETLFLGCSRCPMQLQQSVSISVRDLGQILGR
jgi:hypothetical protein